MINADFKKLVIKHKLWKLFKTINMFRVNLMPDKFDLRTQGIHWPWFNLTSVRFQYMILLTCKICDFTGLCCWLENPVIALTTFITPTIAYTRSQAPHWRRSSQLGGQHMTSFISDKRMIKHRCICTIMPNSVLLFVVNCINNCVSIPDNHQPSLDNNYWIYKTER